MVIRRPHQGDLRGPGRRHVPHQPPGIRPERKRHATSRSRPPARRVARRVGAHQQRDRGPDFTAWAGTGAPAGHSSTSVGESRPENRCTTAVGRAAPRAWRYTPKASRILRWVRVARPASASACATTGASPGGSTSSTGARPRQPAGRHRRAPCGPRLGPATPGRRPPIAHRRRPHPLCAGRRRRRSARRKPGGARLARRAAKPRPAGGPTRTAPAAGRPAQTGGPARRSARAGAAARRPAPATSGWRPSTAAGGAGRFPPRQPAAAVGGQNRGVRQEHQIRRRRAVARHDGAGHPDTGSIKKGGVRRGGVAHRGGGRHYMLLGAEGGL